jgi:hypothetical protein
MASAFFDSRSSAVMRQPQKPAAWGRLFFAPLSFGDAKESGSPTAKALKQKI